MFGEGKKASVCLPGQRYGRLTVIEDAWCRDGHRHVACVCDCGRHTTVRASRIASGHTRSCGCMRRESRARVAAEHYNLRAAQKAARAREMAKILKTTTLRPADMFSGEDYEEFWQDADFKADIVAKLRKENE